MPRKTPFPWLKLAAVTAMGWAGCAHSPVPPPLAYSEILRLSPAPRIATPSEALNLAEEYVQSHPGSDFVIGNGNSMDPLYRDGSLLIVARPELWKLRAGQTVVFVSSSGQAVAHLLVRRSPEGWLTRGLQNGRDDGEVLTRWNYIGAVVQAYQPTGSIVLCHAAASRAGFVAER